MKEELDYSSSKLNAESISVPDSAIPESPDEIKTAPAAQQQTEEVAPPVPIMLAATNITSKATTGKFLSYVSSLSKTKSDFKICSTFFLSLFARQIVLVIYTYSIINPFLCFR